LLGVVAFAVRPRTVDELYRSVVRAAPRRYGRMEAGETPLEFAERFRSHSEYGDVRLLALLYARGRYAGRVPSAHELRLARRAWLRVRRTWALSLVFGRRGNPGRA